MGFLPIGKTFFGQILVWYPGMEFFPIGKITDPRDRTFDRKINKNPGISTRFSTGKILESRDRIYSNRKKNADFRVGIFPIKNYQTYFSFRKKKFRIQKWDLSQKNEILQNPRMGFFPIEENLLNPMTSRIQKLDSFTEKYMEKLMDFFR